jgi:aspartate racemase
MHTPPLAAYVECLDKKDWTAVAALMLRSAEKLAACGADFLICPDNTIHGALPLLAASSPLPWLHIAEVVADAAAGMGYTRVGLTGTRWLVDGEIYPEKLSARGIACVRPSVDERTEINRIIMEELVPGVVKTASVGYFQAVIKRMKEEGSCDAIVLGCTEIPLIISDDNSCLPTLDSTRLLAREALRRAVSGSSKPA